MNHESLRVSNCAGCGTLLLGLYHLDWYLKLTETQKLQLPPLINGYRADRPFCRKCYLSSSIPQRFQGEAQTWENWQAQNGVLAGISGGGDGV